MGNIHIIDSTVDGTCKMFDTAYIKDSLIEAHSLIADEATIISSRVGEKVQIDRRCYIQHASFGYGSYIGMNSLVKFSTIGKYCNLSWHLSIGGSNHNYKAACMYTDSWWKRTFNVGDGLVMPAKSEYAQIGNDVWIGAKANILRGVSVGDGAVVGANSLVLNDVPPYAVAVGVPAKVIKYRFDEEVIERLLNARWWNLDADVIARNAELFRDDLTEVKLAAIERLALSGDRSTQEEGSK